MEQTKKAGIIMEDKEDFERAGFYKTLFDILIGRKGVKTKDLKKGDICLYFDVWRELHRIGDKNVSETFMEVIIGRVENSDPLTLSEAI